MDIHAHEIRNINITSEILKLIAEIDEFKGRWKVMESLAPEKLTSLRRIATIESVGSSTRIEGAKLSDREVEKLLSGVKAKSFASRDEQEVAGYADAMDMVLESFESITVTENHIKQLHGVLLKYSSKDQEHRGHYKKVPNHVEAFGPDGKSLGVVFETATPFETPGWMKGRRLVQLVRQRRNAASVDPDWDCHCGVPGYPSVQRWKWQAFTRPHDSAVAACRVRVRTIQLDGERG